MTAVFPGLVHLTPCDPSFTSKRHDFVSFSTADWYYISYVHHTFAVHLLVEGRVGCFQSPATVGRAAVNMAEQVSEVGFLGMCQGVAQLGHLGGSFWRVLHTDFHSGRTHLQFCQQ